MWRLVFSKKKLTPPQKKSLETILEDVKYLCGALFDELELPPQLETVCVRDHNCCDPIETLYYSAEYNLICYYCASKELDDSVPEEVYLLCCVHFVKQKNTYTNERSSYCLY